MEIPERSPGISGQFPLGIPGSVLGIVPRKSAKHNLRRIPARNPEKNYAENPRNKICKTSREELHEKYLQ